MCMSIITRLCTYISLICSTLCVHGSYQTNWIIVPPNIESSKTKEFNNFKYNWTTPITSYFVPAEEIDNNNNLSGPYVISISQTNNKNDQGRSSNSEATSLQINNNRRIRKKFNGNDLEKLNKSISFLHKKFKRAMTALRNFIFEDEINYRNNPTSEGRKSKNKKKSELKQVKVRRKYKKFIIPLLMAYKLKFFTLIPVFIGALVLLAGSTGMAGFFFALFAAVMSLKSEGIHHSY